MLISFAQYSTTDITIESRISYQLYQQPIIIFILVFKILKKE